MNGAILRIVDRNPGTGPVYKQLLSWMVLLPHHQVALLLPLLIVITEPAITVALGMPGPVFFPEQLQRGVLVLLQFLVDVSKVWQRTLAHRRINRCLRGKQRSFQLSLSYLDRQWPTQPAGNKASQILVHRTLADLDAAGDLTLAQFQLKMQT
jgi:hypothetical protein